MRGVLTLLALLAFAGVAAAQDTGGSFGGGDWSDSSSSSSDYSSSSSSSDYSSSDYSSSGSSSGGGGSLSGSALVWVVIGMLVFYGVVLLAKDGLASLRESGPATYLPHGTVDYVQSDVDVTVLRFALDARTRPFVQKELDRIARSADMRTAEGRTTSLREVALMLRRLRDGWVYGGGRNFAMTGSGRARTTFEQHVVATRALYQRELVRNAAGVVSTGETGAYPRRSYEGGGLVLVTVVVAAKQELFTVTRIGDGDGLRQALEVLSALGPQTLVAMEVVWTPADPEDRMSSVELEALLPDEIFPIEGAMVGKVICTYCGGPFPQELLSCPHCGGRLDAAA